MRLQRLTPEEINILDDLSDVPILETIKGMNEEELKEYDVYRPIDMAFYTSEQNKWIAKEKWLVGTRIGIDPQATPEELIEDFLSNHIPQKYKAYFVLKYPDMVIRRDSVLETVA
ncbi:MAG TPA: hypothetical protein VI815_01890 [Candidatus Nanoarchaeia archaeon]|nr:hypothetical protein [Candidatus Nanoarchaeia archaeon]